MKRLIIASMVILAVSGSTMHSMENSPHSLLNENNAAVANRNREDTVILTRSELDEQNRKADLMIKLFIANGDDITKAINLRFYGHPDGARPDITWYEDPAFWETMKTALPQAFLVAGVVAMYNVLTQQ